MGDIGQSGWREEAQCRLCKRSRHRYLSPALLATLITENPVVSAIKYPLLVTTNHWVSLLAVSVHTELIQSRQGTDTWFADWLQLCTLIVSLWVAARLCGWNRPVQRVETRDGGNMRNARNCKHGKSIRASNIWFVWMVVGSAESIW